MNRRMFFGNCMKIGMGAVLVEIGVAGKVYAKNRTEGKLLATTKVKGILISLWDVKGQYIASVNKGGGYSNYKLSYSSSAARVLKEKDSGTTTLLLGDKEFDVSASNSGRKTLFTLSQPGGAGMKIPVESATPQPQILLFVHQLVMAFAAGYAYGKSKSIVGKKGGSATVSAAPAGDDVMAGPCPPGESPDGPDGLCGDLRR